MIPELDTIDFMLRLGFTFLVLTILCIGIIIGGLIGQQQTTNFFLSEGDWFCVLK